MIERIALTRKDEATVRALYRAGAVYVKVHATRYSESFGVEKWRLTGSHCDAQGKVLRVGAGAKIHPTPHLLSIHSDTPVDLAAELDAGLTLIVQRVANAVSNERFDALAALNLASTKSAAR